MKKEKHHDKLGDALDRFQCALDTYQTMFESYSFEQRMEGLDPEAIRLERQALDTVLAGHVELDALLREYNVDGAPILQSFRYRKRLAELGARLKELNA